MKPETAQVLEGQPSFTGQIPQLTGGAARSLSGRADSYSGGNDSTRFGGAFIVNRGGGPVSWGVLGVFALFIVLFFRRGS